MKLKRFLSLATAVAMLSSSLVMSNFSAVLADEGSSIAAAEEASEVAEVSAHEMAEEPAPEIAEEPAVDDSAENTVPDFINLGDVMAEETPAEIASEANEAATEMASEAVSEEVTEAVSEEVSEMAEVSDPEAVEAESESVSEEEISLLEDEVGVESNVADLRLAASEDALPAITDTITIKNGSNDNYLYATNGVDKSDASEFVVTKWTNATDRKEYLAFKLGAGIKADIKIGHSCSKTICLTSTVNSGKPANPVVSSSTKPYVEYSGIGTDADTIYYIYNTSGTMHITDIIITVTSGGEPHSTVTVNGANDGFTVVDESGAEAKSTNLTPSTVYYIIPAADEIITGVTGAEYVKGKGYRFTSPADKGKLDITITYANIPGGGSGGKKYYKWYAAPADITTNEAAGYTNPEECKTIFTDDTGAPLLEDGTNTLKGDVTKDIVADKTYTLAYRVGNSVDGSPYVIKVHVPDNIVGTAKLYFVFSLNNSRTNLTFTNDTTGAVQSKSYSSSGANTITYDELDAGTTYSLTTNKRWAYSFLLLEVEEEAKSTNVFAPNTADAAAIGDSACGAKVAGNNNVAVYSVGKGGSIGGQLGEKVNADANGLNVFRVVARVVVPADKRTDIATVTNYLSTLGSIGFGVYTNKGTEADLNFTMTNAAVNDIDASGNDTGTPLAGAVNSTAWSDVYVQTFVAAADNTQFTLVPYTAAADGTKNYDPDAKLTIG